MYIFCVCACVHSINVTRSVFVMKYKHQTEDSREKDPNMYYCVKTIHTRTHKICTIVLRQYTHVQHKICTIVLRQYIHAHTNICTIVLRQYIHAHPKYVE